MASSHNVELEAAKFLHKLIQDSKDEPAKLATKLYVILQHMKSSGKEHSMPYQVISRAMETVINQNGLDIEALKSSRLPLTGNTPTGDSTAQYMGSSQAVGVTKDSKAGLADNELPRVDAFASSRPPVGPSSAGHDIYQGSVSHRSGKVFDQESPSSLDSRSANSQSQERRDTANWDRQVNQKDSKKASAKRKRADSSLAMEPHIDNPQVYDTRNTVVNPRKGKLMNKVEPSGSFSVKGGAVSKVQGGMAGVSSSYPVVESGFSSPMQCSGSSYDNHGLVAKMHNERSVEAFSAVSSPLVELSASKGAVDSEHWKQGFMKGAVATTSDKTVEAHLFSANRGEEVSTTLSSSGKVVEHDGGIPNMLANANRIVQAGGPNNTEMSMLRGAAPRDTGKSPISLAPASSVMPFKEQHLKQLRAQCLVFLAFRNGLMPKKLHLEIALGNIFPKEGGTTDGPRKELIDHKGNEQSLNDPTGVPDVTVSFGRVNNARETERNHPGSSSTGNLLEADSLSKEAENPKMEDKNGPPSDPFVLAEERKHLFAVRRKPEAETQTREISESQAFLTTSLQPDFSSQRGLAVSNRDDNLGNGLPQVGRAHQASSAMAINNHMKSEMISWTGIGGRNDASRGSSSAVMHESVPERMDNVPSQLQSLGDCNVQGNQHAVSHLSTFSLREHWKPISGIGSERQPVMSVKDVNVLAKHVSQDDPMVSQVQKRYISDGCKKALDETSKNGSPFTVLERSMEQEEGDKSISTDLPPSPKYTTSEKWIMDQQKKKILLEQNWVLKQKMTDQRIAACSSKLKETVSSSEDISAKTKSVIELKKLQLLKLQRRLRSDFLNDFFKPIMADMDRLKSMKKHRHGRRIKQLEKFEQKMKEERQKRIRERQKEFFSEIEVHKERLDDIFKIKRERWKNFNKYVKEFHKRKERIHRERIDRIQREKINLLKINDVEGYLRMVQDAKSDRVKQLLKETEKYLQKLGTKLQAAKAMATRFELDMDENRTASIVEKNETAVENDDESDQAKHYMESNEKYYLMAHSIKESIAEQPTCLQGGKLREYQMNGLRWLVSLYNNHLNGILADEMGLGKTVQVIALICYLMETKNDRGPFLVVVPSSVLPGWDSEINFWAPSINSIVYAGPPEERRRLFKERILQQKFNVLLTTYEYLMNKHDRPKLSKIHWHYVIIDEGHRIKNASCKLNADLKHYQSSHRLLLTGTPLQNNLEELWALLNFLLPNIFNSSEDFSQWFNKPFESNGDNSPDEGLLSEEENLLIINRLHQVLRPFVLRRLKHKVENQLPEKIERLVRCEASAYQKLLMKRVEDNLGSLGSSKGRSVHNSVMELRNICNHPYLSQLHAEEVDNMMPKHYLPPIVRLCGKLEMLDRLLPKLKATDHRVLFFSTMTRLLDVMEDYLHWKQYRYLRLDGHTSGGERGALIDKFNRPDSPFFIFLLSIRAGGVGVNLQAADTVIIFDTDWNPQVDLQAQARAHRIGQKRDVLVLRLETVQTVEEQVRASAEHKLGVANQSITAGFFDNNTSAEDRKEYLESLLRECKKEEAAPVLDDDALNDLLARSESEIDIFESVDKQRREGEMETWKKLVLGKGTNGSEPLSPLPSRLVTDDDLKPFYEAMKIFEVSNTGVMSNAAVKRKGEYLGGLDTQHYGRGKRAREVRSYEEQWTEEEFEKLCQVESPDSPKPKEEMVETKLPADASGSMVAMVKSEPPVPFPLPPPPPPPPPPPSVEVPPPQSKEVTPPSKRGRGRPKRAASDISASSLVVSAPSGAGKLDMGSQRGTVSTFPAIASPYSFPGSTTVKSTSETLHHVGVGIATSCQSATLPTVAPVSQFTPPCPSVAPGSQSTPPCPSVAPGSQSTPPCPSVAPGSQSTPPCPSVAPGSQSTTPCPIVAPGSQSTPPCPSVAPGSQSTTPCPNVTPGSQSTPPCPSVAPGSQSTPYPRGQSRRTQSGEAPRRRGKKQVLAPPAVPDGLAGHDPKCNEKTQNISGDSLGSQRGTVSSVPQAPGPVSTTMTVITGTVQHFGVSIAPSPQPRPLFPSVTPAPQSVPMQARGQSQKNQSGAEAPRRRGRKQGLVSPAVPDYLAGHDLKPNEQSHNKSGDSFGSQKGTVSSLPVAHVPESFPGPTNVHGIGGNVHPLNVGIAQSTQSALPFPYVSPGSHSTLPCPPVPKQVKGRGQKTSGVQAQSGVQAPRRRGRKPGLASAAVPHSLTGQDPKSNEQAQNKVGNSLGSIVRAVESNQDTPNGLAVQDSKSTEQKDHSAHNKQPTSSSMTDDSATRFPNKNSAVPKVNEVGVTLNSKDGILPTDMVAFQTCVPAGGDIQTADLNGVNPMMKEVPSDALSLETKVFESIVIEGGDNSNVPLSNQSLVGVANDRSLEDTTISTLETAPPGFDLPFDKYENRSREEGDAKLQEIKDPVLDEALVSENKICKPESKLTAGSVGNMAASRQLIEENSNMESNMENTDTVSLGLKTCETCSSEAKIGDLFGTEGRDAPVLALSSQTLGDQRSEDRTYSSMSTSQGVEDPVLDEALVSKATGCESESKTTAGSVENMADSREEDKTCSTMSSLETAAPGFDLSIDKNENQSGKEGDTRTQGVKDHVQDEALLSKPTVSESESKTIAGSVENMADLRQPIEENPIKGGNIEVICEVSSLETNVGEPSGTKDGDATSISGSSQSFIEETKNQSLDSKTYSTVSILETAAPAFNMSIDKYENQSGEEGEAKAQEEISPVPEQALVLRPDICEPESKIPTGSGEDMADSRQIIEEISIIKSTKDVICESLGSESGDAPSLPVTSQCMVEVMDDRSLENRIYPTKSTMEIAAPVFDVPINKDENQSEAEGDAKGQEVEAPVLDEALVSKPMVCEPESKITVGSVENLADSRKLFGENSIVGSNIEVGCTVSLGGHQKDDVPCQKSSPPDNASTGFCVGVSSIQAGSPLACNNAVDSPGVTQNNSANTIDPSLKGSPKSSSLGVGSFEPTVLFVKDDEGDLSGVSEPVPVDPDHSGIVNLDGGFQDGDKSGMPYEESTECYSEATFQSPAISQKADDIGAPPVVLPVDAASGYNTATLHEDPSDKGNLEAPCSGGEDKDPISEPVHSISSACNTELVPKDYGVQQSTRVETTDGGCDEVCNMEIDPLETHASSPRVESNVETVHSITPESCKTELVPKDHGVQLPTRVETIEGHCDEARGMELDPSETHPSSPRVDSNEEPVHSITPESCDTQLVPEDHVVEPPTKIESTDRNCDEVQNMEDDSSETQASSPKIASDAELPEDSKAEMGEPMDVSQDSGMILAEKPSEKSSLPSSPLPKEEEKIESSSEKDPVASSTTLEESKGPGTESV